MGLCGLLLLSACDLIGGDSPEVSECPRGYESRVVFQVAGQDSIQEAHPVAFSPSGAHILLGVTKKDGSEHPALVSRDGTGFRILTEGPGELVRQAYGFSPDGSKVLYTLGKEIRTVGLDGSGPTVLIESTGGNDPIEGDHDPVEFSPDGELLLYNTFHGYDKGWQIHVANADGSNPRRLTDFDEASSAVGFSSDGSTILYHSGGGASADVWTMDPDGQKKRNLTQSSNDGQSAVSFTANSQRILYRSEGIRLMDRDGSNKTVVTENGEDVSTAVTPNGSVIAFMVMGGGLPEISIEGIGLVRSDGTRRTILSGDQCNLSQIVDFSPNGEQFLFGVRGPEGRIQEVRIAELK